MKEKLTGSDSFLYRAKCSLYGMLLTMNAQPKLRPASRLSLETSFRFSRKFASRAKNSEYSHLHGKRVRILYKIQVLDFTVSHPQRPPTHPANSSQAVGKLDNAMRSHLPVCLLHLRGHAHDLIS